MRQSFLAATTLFGLAALFAAGCAGPRMIGPGTSDIPYPPAGEVRAGDIFHLPTGLKLTLDQAMDVIAPSDFVYVGEMHNNLEAHRVQLRIMEELERRYPGKVAVGMEMFREPQQESLDRWVRGELSESEFLKESHWYENWSSDFGYYRGILEFARDRGIDVIALNPSRELQRELAGAAGGGPLPPGLAEQIPDTDASDPYQRAALEGVFAGHTASDKAFDAFYRVQLLWEETMAQRLTDYRRSERGAGKKIVVLAGGWHVRYGFGIPKKVFRRLPLPYSIVLPSEISLPEEKQEELTMDVDLPELPLVAGDFMWMVDYADLEDNRVLMGVMMKVVEGAVAIEQVIEGSPAAAAGMQPGDVFVSLDGSPVAEVADVIINVRGKVPGDTGTAVVRRGDEELTFTLTYAAAGEGHPK